MKSKPMGENYKMASCDMNHFYGITPAIIISL